MPLEAITPSEIEITFIIVNIDYTTTNKST